MRRLVRGFVDGTVTFGQLHVAVATAYHEGERDPLLLQVWRLLAEASSAGWTTEELQEDLARFAVEPAVRIRPDAGGVIRDIDFQGGDRVRSMPAISAEAVLKAIHGHQKVAG